MGLDLIRWKANERVGLPDQDAVSDLMLEEQIRKNRDLVLPTSITPKVFGGFGLSGHTPLGTVGTATLAYGRAIMKLQKDQALSHGFFLGLQNPTSYLLDFTAAADDTYDVYIRAVYSDGDFENRVFWNPGSSAEYIDYTSTRRLVTWEATYQAQGAASPGQEWMRVWEVTVASNLITGVNDVREFYFEGKPDDTYDHEWGDGANDRDNDRGLYGVQDRWTWDEAVRRQIADIMGSGTPTKWWVAAPMDLTSLNLEHYSQAESGTGTPGEHKKVTVGPTGARHRLDSVTLDDWRIRSLDQAAVAEMRMEVTGANGDMIIAPRGAGNLLTASDRFRWILGDDGISNDVVKDVTKNAANDYTVQELYGGYQLYQAEVGTAVAQQAISFQGEVEASEGFRISPIATTEVLIVPLEKTNDQGAVSWYYDTGGNPENNDARLTVTTGADFLTHFEIVLPHNAILNKIRVLWAQSVTAGGGSPEELRLYAQKHRIGQTTVGQVGGGTGTPSTQINLKTINNYIEQSLAGGSPHREIAEFTCNEILANRTFDMTQDKLVITLKSPNAAAPVVSVYWILVEYGLDYVTPPLA